MRASIRAVVLFLFLFYPFSLMAVPLIDCEFALGGWVQRPSGDMGISLNGLGASDLSLKDDFSYGTESNFSGRFKLDMPLFIPNIYVMGTLSEFSGNGKLQKDFNFAGKKFNANQDFYSELKLDHLDVALYYGLPFLELLSLGSLGIDFGLNLRIYQLDASLTQDGVTTGKSSSLPIPMGYLAARFAPLGSLALEAELRGLSVGGNKLISGIGRLKYNIVELPLLFDIFVAGGWRHDIIDIKASGIMIDSTFTGPFVEAGLSF